MEREHGATEAAAFSAPVSIFTPSNVAFDAALRAQIAFLSMKILSGLAEGQVLQRLGSRGANARLRGATSQTGPLHATIFKGKSPLKGWKKRGVGRAARGKFDAKLEAIPTGGPYRLKLDCGSDFLESKSVLRRRLSGSWPAKATCRAAAT